MACVILDNLKGESIEKQRNGNRGKRNDWLPLLSNARLCNHLESISEYFIYFDNKFLIKFRKISKRLRNRSMIYSKYFTLYSIIIYR